MTQIISKNPIVKKIVDGEAKDDVLAFLVSKQLPFTEEEYLESLVFALKYETYKSKALELLKQIPESTKSSYIEKQHANHRVAYFILLEALNWQNLSLTTKAINNQALPYEFLIKIAEKGNQPILEALLDNQIKLIAYPEIMEMMEKNPEITKFIHGKILELRDYYLREENAEEIQAEDVLEDVKEVLAMEQESTKEEDSDTEEDELLEDLSEIEEKTLTLLQEINTMTIPERIRLALTGGRTHRMILVKDTNKMVAKSVVASPKLTVDEVVLIARNRSIAGEIISTVSRNREWTKNYTVLTELVQNPKTPIKDALGFVKKLHMRDLRILSRNKNINPVVRSLAFNFLVQLNIIKIAHQPQPTCRGKYPDLFPVVAVFSRPIRGVAVEMSMHSNMKTTNQVATSYAILTHKAITFAIH